MEILASRMLIRPVDYPKSVEFYRDGIGLAIAREYGAGTVFTPGSHSSSWPVTTVRPNPGVPRRGVAAGARRLRDPGGTGRPRRGHRPGCGRGAVGLHEMHVTDPDGITLIFVQVPDTHPLRRDTR